MKLRKILVIIMALLLCFGCVACKKDGFSKDPNTLNIRVYKAGYGDAYITAMAQKFQEAYFEQGYKVNIVESSESVLGQEVINELSLGKKNKIDMYFTGHLSTTDLYERAEDKGFDLVADLTDIYDSYPINMFGKEEQGKKIKDKVDPLINEYLVYKGDNPEYKDTYLTFPLYKSPSSLVVNTSVMEKYNLDIPLTTNQLVSAVETIAKKIGETGIYPISWAGYNAYAYWHCCEDLWAAQYDGYDKFMQTITLDGFADPRDAISVYDYKGYEYSLTVMDTMLNLDYAAPGTINMGHGNAQHDFITGKSAFMANSGWLNNEMAANYSKYMDDIVMIKMPIISELGVKLGLDGNNGSDRAKCEAVLIDVIKGIDADKDNATIVSEIQTAQSVTLTEDQVAAVRTARFLMYDRGGTNHVVISASSQKQNIAKLFLRMFASEASGQYLLNFANATSPFILESELDVSSSSEFVKSTLEMCDARYTGINRAYYGKSLRNEAAVELFYGYTSIEKTMASSDGLIKGADLWKDIGNVLKGNGPNGANDSLIKFITDAGLL